MIRLEDFRWCAVHEAMVDDDRADCPERAFDPSPDERLATPDEVGDGWELGVVFTPRPCNLVDVYAEGDAR